MDITAGHDAFVNFTPADFYQTISSGRIEDTQQEETEGERMGLCISEEITLWSTPPQTWQISRR